MKSQSQELAGLSRQVDDANIELDKCECEMSCLKSTLESAATRHFEELNRYNLYPLIIACKEHSYQL